MEGKTCQQCHQVTNVTFNRMVRDSCGHEKCRMCLLRDDTKCLACLNNSSVDNAPKENNDGCLVENRRCIYINEETLLNVVNAKELDSNGSEIKQKPQTNHDILNNKPTNVSRIILCNKSCDIDKKNKTQGYSKEYTSITSNINNVHDFKENPIKRSPRKSLPSHILLERGVDSAKQSYTCTVCNRKFRSRSQVSFHAHCNSANPFTCTICQQRFANCSHFTVHMNIHYGNKIFVCDICSDSFHQKSKLIRHLLVHSDLRPYKCSDCNATFATTIALKRHGVSHSSVKAHECKTCGKKFRDVSNLRKHELKHSGVRYTCTECGKHYTIKCSLMLHMKSHSKDRPETCSHCPKTFYSKKDKNRHELTHLEVKQFQCLLCNIRCRRKDNLVRHFRNTHPEIDRNAISENSLEMKLPEKMKSVDADDIKQKKRNSKPKPDIIHKLKIDDNKKSDESFKLPESTEVLNEPKSIVGDANNHAENVKTFTLTRSDVIEANNKRQSVIFNSQRLITQVGNDCKSLDTIAVNNDIIVDNAASSVISEENLVAKNLPKVVNKPIKPAFTIFPPNSSSDFTKYKINDNISIPRNENTMLLSNINATQKKTVDVNEAYKQLFPTIKHNESLSIQARNFDAKKNDSKVYPPAENLQNAQRNSSREQLYYDHKKYLPDYTSFNSTEMLHNTSNYYKGNSKYTGSSSRSFLQDDNEQTAEFSPESIELYKKILIPSYRGSNETAKNTSSSISAGGEIISNKVLPLIKASADCNKEEFPPPLVPISNGNSNFYADQRSFRPESQLKDNFVGNLTAINDVHWRRRLALNSNNIDL